MVLKRSNDNLLNTSPMMLDVYLVLSILNIHSGVILCENICAKPPIVGSLLRSRVTPPASLVREQ